jgi:hypothetical protein
MLFASVLTRWFTCGVTLAPLVTNVTFSGGQLWISHDFDPPVAWDGYVHVRGPIYDWQGPDDWWRGSFVHGPGWWVTAVPLWALCLPLLIGTVWAWSPRRSVSGKCPSCRYSRFGLAAGTICPECGAPPPSSPRATG